MRNGRHDAYLSHVARLYVFGYCLEALSDCATAVAAAENVSTCTGPYRGVWNTGDGVS